MASESVRRRLPPSSEDGEPRGQLLYFPDRRALGPLSWRTVRIASLAVLVLLLSGALLELFLLRTLRDVHSESRNVARVPS